MTIFQKINNYFRDFWVRKFDFKGRSNRDEYWYGIIFNFLAWFIFVKVLLIDIAIAFAKASNTSAAGVVGIFALCATTLYVIASYAVYIRRMRDTGRSPWWCFWLTILQFIPYVYNVFVVLVGIVNLYLLTRPSYKNKSEPDFIQST